MTMDIFYDSNTARPVILKKTWDKPVASRVYLDDLVILFQSFNIQGLRHNPSFGETKYLTVG